MPESAPAPLAWGHINLNVADLDRSIAFYEKLGFTVFVPSIPYLGLSVSGHSSEIDGPSADALGIPRGTRGRACIMQLGEGFPKLDLTELSVEDAAAPLHNTDRGFVRICLATSDLAAETTRLGKAGVEFESEPISTRGDLAEIAVCRDPDGALIELIQIHLERWATLPGAD